MNKPLKRSKSFLISKISNTDFRYNHGCALARKETTVIITTARVQTQRLKKCQKHSSGGVSSLRCPVFSREKHSIWPKWILEENRKFIHWLQSSCFNISRNRNLRPRHVVESKRQYLSFICSGVKVPGKVQILKNVLKYSIQVNILPYCPPLFKTRDDFWITWKAEWLSKASSFIAAFPDSSCEKETHSLKRAVLHPDATAALINQS